VGAASAIAAINAALVLRRTGPELARPERELVESLV
jgi:hypothetical protein